MKALIGISIAATMLTSISGFSQQNTNNKGMDDDGIYSPPSSNSSVGQPANAAQQTTQNNNTTQAAPAPAPQSVNQASTGGPADSGNVNNYTGTDNYYSQDYSDYNYSSQLKRYDDDWGNNWGYYDDVYTNSYWYNYNPYSFGMSIYYPSYWSLGFGYPYYGFGFGYPYYGFGFGYPYWGFGRGWGNGGWCGAWGGYYNSYDRNSNFVGPRASIGPGALARGGSAVGPGAHGSPTTGPGERAPSFGEMYQNSLHNEAAKNPSAFVKSSNGNLHVATTGTNSRINSRISQASSRPMASYRSNSAMNSSAMANRSNAGYNAARNNRGYANSARPNYSNRGYSRTGANANYGQARVAPNQGSRSGGNYNYRASYTGSRNYGGASHSFNGGGSAHSSGGGHSFGGGGFSGGSHGGGGGGGFHGGGGGRR